MVRQITLISMSLQRGPGVPVLKAPWVLAQLRLFGRNMRIILKQLWLIWLSSCCESASIYIYFILLWCLFLHDWLQISRYHMLFQMIRLWRPKGHYSLLLLCCWSSRFVWFLEVYVQLDMFHSTAMYSDCFELHLHESSKTWSIMGQHELQATEAGILNISATTSTPGIKFCSKSSSC